MGRLISAKGVTAGVTIGSPMVGMKWIVKWAMVILHTGTGTGNRQAQLVVVRANNAYNAGPGLAITGVVSGTSTIYAAEGDVSNYINASGTTYQAFPEVFAIDAISLLVNLQSGDTVDYYIMVEEASS